MRSRRTSAATTLRRPRSSRPPQPDPAQVSSRRPGHLNAYDGLSLTHESDGTTVIHGSVADPLRAWRLRNAEPLTDDCRLSHDPGGSCTDHRRWLTWPEQRRGACSWCVSVDPEREPEYWASHRRRFRAP